MCDSRSIMSNPTPINHTRSPQSFVGPTYILEAASWGTAPFSYVLNRFVGSETGTISRPGSLFSRNYRLGMEEQFTLTVPPSVPERIERLLNENSSSFDDKSLDLSLCVAEDERSGMFVIGNDHFPSSLLDLPCVMESYKTYDDSVLIKTADIGQPELVQQVGKDLLNIMVGGIAENMDVEAAEPKEDGDEHARSALRNLHQHPTKN